MTFLTLARWTELGSLLVWRIRVLEMLFCSQFCSNFVLRTPHLDIAHRATITARSSRLSRRASASSIARGNSTIMYTKKGASCVVVLPSFLFLKNKWPILFGTFFVLHHHLPGHLPTRTEFRSFDRTHPDRLPLAVGTVSRTSFSRARPS